MQNRFFLQERKQRREFVPTRTQRFESFGRHSMRLRIDASQPGSEYIVRAENFFACCKTCTANQGTVIIIGAIGKANADAHAIIHLVVRRGQGTNAVDIEFPEMIELAFVLMHISIFENTGSIEITLQFERTTFDSINFEHSTLQQKGGDLLKKHYHFITSSDGAKRRACGLKIHIHLFSFPQS